MAIDSVALWDGIRSYLEICAALEPWRTGVYSTPRALRVFRQGSNLPIPSVQAPCIVVDLLGIDEPDDHQTDRAQHGLLTYHFQIEMAVEAATQEEAENGVLRIADAITMAVRENGSAGFTFGMAADGAEGSTFARATWSPSSKRVHTAWQARWTKYLDVWFYI